MKITVRFICLFLLVSGLVGCASPRARFFWPPPPAEPKLEYLSVYYSEAQMATGAGKAFQRFAGKLGNHVFQNPFGIVSDPQGKVYISDPSDQNVHIFDFTTGKASYLSEEPIGTPYGLALDSAGKLYVCDIKSKTILVFDGAGKLEKRIGGPDLLERPVFLALNESLGRLYVSDSHGHRIVVFDLEGNHLFSFGKRGVEDGEFNFPQGIAIDRKDRVFVADGLNTRVQVLDAAGKFLYKFGERGDRQHQFESLRGLAFDQEGHLYIVDNRKGAVLVYTPEGQLLLYLGAGHPTNSEIGFGMPQGIWIDQQGKIFVADYSNARFAVWQFVTDDYLKNNPVTEADRNRMTEYLKKMKEVK